MLVRFLCPACHQLLGIAPRKVGAQVNCPKCGATILVPSPEESPPAEPVAVPPADVPLPDFTAPEPDAADTAVAGDAGNLATSTEAPPDAVGFDVLGDVGSYERPSVGPAAKSSIRRTALPDLALDDDRIVISRRVLYFQAVLLAVVGLLALAAGYLIGSGAGSRMP